MAGFSLGQCVVVGVAARADRSDRALLIRSGNRLDVVSDRTLFIDRSADAVVIDNLVFLADRQRFQRVFGFLEQLREQAGATFDTVITA